MSAHHGAFARRFAYDMHDDASDSLVLDTTCSAADIEGFRRRPHPMCRYCDNDQLTVVSWERSRLSAKEWLRDR